MFAASPVIDSTRFAAFLVRFPGDFSPFQRPSGAFFSLRCLIYKVHAVPGGVLLILQDLFLFVKNFFQKFLTFKKSRKKETFSILSGGLLPLTGTVTTALTALLGYQRFPVKSTHFFTVCSFFLHISRFFCFFKNMR